MTPKLRSPALSSLEFQAPVVYCWLDISVWMSRRHHILNLSKTEPLLPLWSHNLPPFQEMALLSFHLVKPETLELSLVSFFCPFMPYIQSIGNLVNPTIKIYPKSSHFSPALLLPSPVQDATLSQVDYYRNHLTGLPAAIVLLPIHCPNSSWNCPFITLFLSSNLSCGFLAHSDKRYYKIWPCYVFGIIFFQSFPTYSVSSPLASLPYLEPYKFILTSGPLHLLFPHQECSALK